MVMGPVTNLHGEHAEQKVQKSVGKGAASSSQCGPPQAPLSLLRRPGRPARSTRPLRRQRPAAAPPGPVDVKKLTSEQIEDAWLSTAGLNGVRAAGIEELPLRQALADFVGKKIAEAENLEYEGEEQKLWRDNFKKKSSIALYVKDANGDFSAGAVLDKGKGWLYIKGLAANGGGGQIVQQLKAYVKADPKLHWMGADAVRGAAYEYWTLAMAFQPLESVRKRLCEISFKDLKDPMAPMMEHCAKKSLDYFRDIFKWGEHDRTKYLPVAWYPFYG